ncbi:ABC transporter permease [Marinicauda salina]|uniref:ABC transporter permease n=1 Tax=Marinicauda salina TaxID=2135793 RepID=A0A2U2BTY1_9PROT|nr:ABC transporter permease/substrate-binding protein [Marinicauda salina]PWE17476.1 ABC transporter permease [Marinicauda salina]
MLEPLLDQLADPMARLPDYLGGHMRLSLLALAAGLSISLPLGVLASRNKTLAGPALGVASVMQTIPSLALLALMVPLLGGTIGFAPAFIALTLYGVLPVLRNTIVALQGVAPPILEAARGVGMTRVQSLARVELPLALPTIVAGVRTATVWIVGTATLATPVGATSLGNYIFSGLQTRNWTTVVFGCIAAAVLALVLDQLIRQLEVAAARRQAPRALAAGAALVALIAGALAPTMIPRGGTAGAGRSAVFADDADAFGGEPVVIGSKSYTEQYILADVLAARLEAAGATVRRRENLGSTVVFDALVSGEVDVYVDYTGTLWANIMNRSEPIDRHRMYAETSAWLLETHGVLMLGRLGYENAYGFAVTQETAARLPARTIGALSSLDGLSIGSDPEFFARPEWTRVREAYGLAGAEQRNMDATFMYGAVRDGAVDAVTAYTTDGRIAAYDLVVLDDPAGALPPYDAVILLSPEAAARPAVARALAPLIGAIDVELMREANAAVDVERRRVSDAAALILERLEDRSGR